MIMTDDDYQGSHVLEILLMREPREGVRIRQDVEVRLHDVLYAAIRVYENNCQENRNAFVTMLNRFRVLIADVQQHIETHQSIFDGMGEQPPDSPSDDDLTDVIALLRIHTQFVDSVAEIISR